MKSHVVYISDRLTAINVKSFWHSAQYGKVWLHACSLDDAKLR